ncbi:MAG: FecR family protein [Firmicutes bacterium]|nr:FecR family protein [Bacillota bacterium]
MNKKIILAIIGIVSVSLLVFLLLPGWGISPNWKLVVKLTGTVESQKADQTSWVGIWRSRMLEDGDKARTLDKSLANIRLADQSIIKMGPNTVVEMAKFQLTEQSRLAQLKMDAGVIRVKVGKFSGKESKFEVKTPNAVLAARGTDFYVKQEKVTKQGPGGNTNIIVFSGVLDVNNGRTSITLLAGNTCTVTPGGVLIPNAFQFPSIPGTTTPMLHQSPSNAYTPANTNDTNQSSLWLYGAYAKSRLTPANTNNNTYDAFGYGNMHLSAWTPADSSVDIFISPNEEPVPVNLTTGQFLTIFPGPPGGNMPPPGGGPGPGSTYMNLDPSIRVLNPTLDISF